MPQLNGQTVSLLHGVSKVAHLDITSGNIMLRKEGFDIWDQLWLVDFGFSHTCSSGMHCMPFASSFCLCMLLHYSGSFVS